MTDTKEKVEEVHRRAKEESPVHVIQLGSMTVGEGGKELADIEGMAQAGCYALSEDGKSVMNASLFRKAMRKAKENDLLIFSHCEDISHGRRRRDECRKACRGTGCKRDHEFGGGCDRGTRYPDRKELGCHHCICAIARQQTAFG